MAQICGVRHPYQRCDSCADDPKIGCCVTPDIGPDCYLHPGSCNKDQWCQLNDRKSWNDTDATTMGRCVQYQRLCESCTADYTEENPKTIPALDAYDFYSPDATTVGGGRPEPGRYIERATRCGEGLTCTGDLVPALPPTCVARRPLPNTTRPVGKAQVYEWAKRWVRMGARNLYNKAPHFCCSLGSLGVVVNLRCDGWH